MSAAFVRGSTQYLLNSAVPVTTYPFTVAMWFYALADGVGECLWSLENSSDDAGWSIAKNTSNVIEFSVFGAGANWIVSLTGAITASAWHFVAARAISATNRRAAMLRPDGSITHANDTNSLTPSSITLEALGVFPGGTPNGPFTGRLAEYALWNADVQGDGAQLQDRTLRQMAYGGPFSLPYLAKNLIEYRSLRSSLESSKDKANEIYGGAGKPRQVWTNVAGAKLGPHVPLPAGYTRQFQGSL